MVGLLLALSGGSVH